MVKAAVFCGILTDMQHIATKNKRGRLMAGWLLAVAALLSVSPLLAAEEGSKRLVIGDVPPHTVGAYRPFTIPGEIKESDGMVERRKGREIVIWCPESLANSKPKKVAAAKRFVESPFLPIKSLSVGYVGGKAGEALLKELGVVYTTHAPSEAWKLAGYQMLVLGPGTAELFTQEKQKEYLRKMLASRKLLVLPGADLSLLPFGLTRASAALSAAAAAVPDLPLFAGIRKDFEDFNAKAKGYSCPVSDKGPGWMQTTSPACFAHVKNRGQSIVVFNVAPSDVPAEARDPLTRVWCTILANLNIESGVEGK